MANICGVWERNGEMLRQPAGIPCLKPTKNNHGNLYFIPNFVGSLKILLSSKNGHASLTAAGDHIRNFSPSIRMWIVNLNRIWSYRGSWAITSSPASSGVKKAIHRYSADSWSWDLHWSNFHPFFLQIKKSKIHNRKLPFQRTALILLFNIKFDDIIFPENELCQIGQSMSFLMMGSILLQWLSKEPRIVNYSD